MISTRDLAIQAYNEEKQNCLPDSPCFLDERFGLIGIFSLDVFQLEDWIQEKHGQIPENMSLKDFVKQHYGEKAIDFVKKYA